MQRHPRLPGTWQANQVGHLVCDSCSITLMYAHGAQSVKCAVCNHVTPVSASAAAQPMPAGPPAGQQPMLAVNGGGSGHGGAGGAHSGGNMAHGGGGGGGGTTVVVENPPSLDEHGNEVQNIAVGVTSKDSSAAGAARG